MVFPEVDRARSRFREQLAELAEARVRSNFLCHVGSSNSRAVLYTKEKLRTP